MAIGPRPRRGRRSAAVGPGPAGRGRVESAAEGPAMKHFRLSTLMLLIVIVALSGALALQSIRAERIRRQAEAAIWAAQRVRVAQIRAVRDRPASDRARAPRQRSRPRIRRRLPAGRSPRHAAA